MVGFARSAAAAFLLLSTTTFGFAADKVIVILDGEDKARRFPAAMTVLLAIRRSLPPRDRPNASDFEMVDGNLGTSPLDVNLTLKAAGVRDGHVLSITKKNGGGG